MEITINTTWSRAEVKSLVRSIPSALAGTAPDPHGFADGFKARLAAGWIKMVEQDYNRQQRGSSGELRKSLAAGQLIESGHLASYAPPDASQFYDASRPGQVSIGTNVEYSQHVHKRRPLWPEEELPQEWQDAVMDQARMGIQRIVEMIK